MSPMSRLSTLTRWSTSSLSASSCADPPRHTGADAWRAKADPKRPREEEGDGEVGEPGGHDHEVSDSVQPDCNYFTKLRSAWKMQALQMFSYLTYLTKQLMLRNITSYVCTQIVQTKQLVHHLSLLETSITSHRWRRAMSFNSICLMSTHYRRCKTVGRLERGYINVKGAYYLNNIYWFPMWWYSSA